MTVTNEVQIYNLALNAVGDRDFVSSTTEESRQAQVCKLWYATVRDMVLSAAPWPVARKTRLLAKLKERGDGNWADGDPEPGYRFAYATPTDMLRPRFLSSYARFELSALGASRVIMTNDARPILTYTFRNEQISTWDEQLKMAVASTLAAFIAMSLHAKPQRARLAEERANDLVLMAQETAANSDNFMMDSVPDWISARGYAETLPRERFIFPSAPLVFAHGT